MISTATKWKNPKVCSVFWTGKWMILAQEGPLLVSVVFVVSAVSHCKIINPDSFLNGCKNVLSGTGGLSCGSIYISFLKAVLNGYFCMT